MNNSEKTIVLMVSVLPLIFISAAIIYPLPPTRLDVMLDKLDKLNAKLDNTIESKRAEEIKEHIIREHHNDKKKS